MSDTPSGNAQSRYYERRRKLVDDAKSVPCMDCDTVYPVVCMDLDHRDPSTKLFNPSQWHTRGYEAIRAELDKCDAVCANCHRLRTWGDRDVQLAMF